jgi:uroporphyrinogen decarboxylase
MNSKERIIAAINHQETDRPCANFRAEPTAIEKIFRHVGYRDIERLQDELDTDMRHIDAITPPDIKMDGFSQNFWGERYIFNQTPFGPERENISGVASNMKSLDEISKFDWISNDDFDYSNIPTLCAKHENRAIMYGSGDIWQRAVMIRGMQNFFIDMYENPDICHFLSNKLCEFYIEDYRRAFEASSGKIDIFLIYSDLGSQRSPLISSEMLETFVLPYIRRIAKAVHEMGAYLFFHTCGMVTPFIPQLINAGVDILDPIQPVTDCMQPEALAKRFANQICFHGGIDVQRVLVTGSKDDVKREVKRYIASFKGKCGYICAPSHFIQKDISVENILAMYEAIKT